MRREKLLEKGPNQAYCGIIQLRCENQEKLEKIFNFIRDAATRGVYALSKITKFKEGFDFYLTDRSLLHHLGGQLELKYGGYRKSSSKLVTRNRLTGKPVHRCVIYFRAFPYQLGDIVIFQGKPVKILKVSKRVAALDLAAGKNISFEYKEGQVLEQLHPEEAHVSQHQPHLMLLHPETFQPVRPENQASLKKESYQVVVIGSRVYIV